MTWPDATLGARLSAFVVLAHDPAVPEVAADWWEISGPHYLTVAAAVAETFPDVAEVAALAASPTDPVLERALTARLEEVLERSPEERDRLAKMVAAAEEHILIDYHRGTEAGLPAEPVALPDVQPWLRPRPEPAARAESSIHSKLNARAESSAYPEASARPSALVVIPFRDRVGGARARNLLACLSALADQRDSHDVVITVVESDDEPRWRESVEPWVDHYLFAPHTGHFNKSWTVNVGARNTPAETDVICVLDADVLVDDAFLTRNLDRFAADPGLGSFLPYRSMFCLDEDSSHAAIRSRLSDGEPYTSLSAVRALVLREPPGACLWVRTGVFTGIGGFDERYTGWGGEDDDVVARLARAARLERFDDPLIHLAHPRPQMLLDGNPFNAHLEPMSWTAPSGYGDLRGPAAVA